MQAGAQDIGYRLTVHEGDTTGYDVEMRLQHVPHQFKLAMATHHEYDDKFYRFVRDFRVVATGGEAGFVRVDSAVYALTVSGDRVIVSYRIQLPPHRFAHQSFLSRNGGMVGDVHSFFYLVGGTKIPATVDFDLPAGWTIATGLEPAGHVNSFRVSSAKMLMDCPALVGRLWEWHFKEGGIPYRVSYLPVNRRPVFDTATFVSAIGKIVHAAVGLFGGVPYTHYDFLLVDGVFGALEHGNSVTIGAPADELVGHMPDLYEQVAHEFFHTWNLVNIEPSGYTDLNYGPQEVSAGLWFSEGLTMFYADLLVRRAGLPTEDSTRLAHLSALIGRYYSDTGDRVLDRKSVV